eukprot:COSAG02_NODE_924_length_15868_cov_165.380430_2_plen_170_part_00
MPFNMGGCESKSQLGHCNLGTVPTRRTMVVWLLNYDCTCTTDYSSSPAPAPALAPCPSCPRREPTSAASAARRQDTARARHSLPPICCSESIRARWQKQKRHLLLLLLGIGERRDGLPLRTRLELTAATARRHVGHPEQSRPQFSSQASTGGSTVHHGLLQAVYTIPPL